MAGIGEAATPAADAAAPGRPTRTLRERVPRWATSLSAKYAVVFALLVAATAIATSAYLLTSSYDQRKRELIRLQQEKANSLVAAVGQELAMQVARLRSVPLTGYSGVVQKRIVTALVTSPNVLAISYLDPAGHEIVRMRSNVTGTGPGLFPPSS